MELHKTQPQPAAPEAEAEAPAGTGLPPAEPAHPEPEPEPEPEPGPEPGPGPATPDALAGSEDAPESEDAREPAGAPEEPPAEASDRAPEPAGAPASPDVPVPPPGPAPRRRGRTAVLLAVAAVIGISGGTAVGYKVQADRPPTPLPALNQPGLAYPAKPLPASAVPDPLSAAEDHGVKTDGDLRKLLVPRPKHARASEAGARDGWMDTATYAQYFEGPAGMFARLTESDLRRVARVAWSQGEHKDVDVSLVQFRSGEGAIQHAEGQLAYLPDPEHAGNDGTPLKGSGNGRYYLFPVEREAGYLPLYRARAVFQRGDVMVDINIFDTKRIGRNEIRSLAERQLERLS
ncbi:hypothetical protein [Streptomyces wuyuanensis]|uniref:hypothetical protein n=1 Tax=Streptomyces wuyuanensis TaxID=1196353 RepID=UPI00371668B5